MEHNKISKYLGSKGYSIAKKDISVSQQNKIRHECTIVPYCPPGSMKKPDPIKVYRESPKKMYMPRFYGIQEFGIYDMSNISKGKSIDIKFNGNLRDFQEKIVSKYIHNIDKHNGCGLLDIPCGSGKCLGKNTEILMFNGDIEKVQNIKVGDVLMGDDSTPRKVLSIARGREKMYRIRQSYGEDYVVNESHILSLKQLRSISKYSMYAIKMDNNEKNVCQYDYYNTDLDTFSSMDDDNSLYVSSSNNSVYSDLSETEDTLYTYDYVKVDIPLTEYLKEQTMLYSNIYSNKTYYGYKVPIQFKYIETNIDVYEYGKHVLDHPIISYIPEQIKLNSNEVQERFIQGFIDSYGIQDSKIPYTYTIHMEEYLNNEVEINNDFKNHLETIVNDLVFIVRCVGYYAIYVRGTITIQLKKGDHNGETMNLIHIESLGEDEYYGFTLDGNHRFVLSDFTVTHNTVMGLNIISKLKKKTLVIVHKEFLMNQWIERIEQFLPNARVGKIQGQKIDVENKDIVLGMLQSLSMKEYPQSLFDQFGFTIVDECFPYDTKVYTDKGYMYIGTLYTMWLNSSRNIKNSLEIPLILSYNEKTKTFEYKKMTYCWGNKKSKEFIEIKCDNMIFECTPNHKIMTSKGYKKACTIKKNDLLLSVCMNVHKDTSSNCNVVRYTIVKDVQKNKFPEINVYDIEVEDNHNFVIYGESCIEYTTNTKNYYLDGVVVHNCHHISAEVFCRSLFKVVTPYMLGLSATMNRKDGLTKIFKMFLGEVIHKEKRKNEHNVEVHVIQYNYKVDAQFCETIYNFKGQTHYALMIRKLCECKHRSNMILTLIQQIFEDKRQKQIMVIAHNKSLLKYLHDEVGVRNIGTVGYYVGGMKEKDLKESESKQIVISTYAMAEEALDIKSLDTLIMCTPKTDVTQTVGRILRQKHDRALVIDIVDSHDIFQKQYKKRQKHYMKEKYKIVEMDWNTMDSILKQNKNILSKEIRGRWTSVFQPSVNDNENKKNMEKIHKKNKLSENTLLQTTCLIDMSKFV